MVDQHQQHHTRLVHGSITFAYLRSVHDVRKRVGGSEISVVERENLYRETVAESKPETSMRVEKKYILTPEYTTYDEVCHQSE